MINKEPADKDAVHMFTIHLERTDTYMEAIQVKARSLEEAIQTTQAKLDDGGWDAVVNDDGYYTESCSEIAGHTCPRCGQFVSSYDFNAGEHTECPPE